MYTERRFHSSVVHDFVRQGLIFIAQCSTGSFNLVFMQLTSAFGEFLPPAFNEVFAANEGMLCLSSHACFSVERGRGMDAGVPGAL